MKKLLTERFQELAGIKPLHKLKKEEFNEEKEDFKKGMDHVDFDKMKEGPLDEADYNNELQDISNKMMELPSEEHKSYLEAIQKFVEEKLRRLGA